MTCTNASWRMRLKGRKLVKCKDNEEILAAGHAHYMSPAHSTMTVAGREWVEFSPNGELRKTNEVVQRNLAGARER